MDLITRAIEKKLHICGDERLQRQTWELFQEQSKDKKIFIFGGGSGLDYFFRNCCNHINITEVIDNDKKKQGQRLGWYCAEAFQTEYEHLIIQSPDILKRYNQDKVVVLITSTAYYQSMAEQIKQYGITSCFIMLLMEANARKIFPYNEDFSKVRQNYIKWCCQQKIVPNKIVMSYGEYGGHAKYITKELLKRRTDLDIVWLVYDENMDIPDGVRPVPEKNWKSYTYEMETAKIWLFDITVHRFIVKRKGQIYIQAKHWSSLTLKKFYLDDKSSCVSPEIAEWIKYNGKMMDYLLSGSKFDEDSCKTGFAFNGTAIRVGSARSDALFCEGIKEKVYNYYKLKLDAHVILYAPTYRKKELLEKKNIWMSLDIDMLLDAVREKFGGDWYIFIRLHPWMSFEKCNLEEGEYVINVGKYPDSEELVSAADIMITDYSSIMFEAAFSKKPVFLYAPDRKEYIEKERGLLLDYASLPFITAESNEGLIQCIMNFDRQGYEKKLAEFLDRYEVHEDGHASERAAQFIIGLLNEDGGRDGY